MNKQYPTLADSLLKPYISLQDDGFGPLMRYAPLLCFSNVKDSIDRLPLQRLLSGAFRRSLQNHITVRSAVNDPRELPEPQRSAEWGAMCELLEGYDSLETEQQNRLLQLLLYLGFYSLVTMLAQKVAAHRLNNAACATQALIRSGALMMLAGGGRFKFDGADFEEIIRNAPAKSLARFTAARALLVHYARDKRDLPRASECRLIRHEILSDATAFRNKFELVMYRSGYFRAASYVPMLKGDFTAMVAEMNECESLGHEACQVAQDEHQRITATEGMHPIYESRMREALVLCDYDLAHERATAMVSLDPYDSKAWIELGESHYRLQRFAAAREAFFRASTYAPPGAEVAIFLSASCNEKLGRQQAAFNDYLRLEHLDRGNRSTQNFLKHSPSRFVQSAATWMALK